MSGTARDRAQQRLRNRHATAPIMQKGGVHEKTRKAERKREKQDLKKELGD